MKPVVAGVREPKRMLLLLIGQYDVQGSLQHGLCIEHDCNNQLLEHFQYVQYICYLLTDQNNV